jgi:MarR family transcriptional regulator, transcriptional regulator for hemolysin
METRTDVPSFAEIQPSMSVQEKFGMAIGDVGRLWRDRLNRRLKPIGLSQTKWRALLYLSRLPEGVTQSALARMLSIEAPSATRLIQQLEAAGWLTRHSSSVDGRRKMVQVTAKARKIIVRIDAEVKQLRAETVGKLSTEQAAAGLAVLQALQSFLSEL